MKSTLGEGRDQSARTHPPLKKIQDKKTHGENSLGQGTKSPHSEPCTWLYMVRYGVWVKGPNPPKYMRAMMGLKPHADARPT